jgi:hypothetical protein
LLGEIDVSPPSLGGITVKVGATSIDLCERRLARDLERSAVGERAPYTPPKPPTHPPNPESAEVGTSLSWCGKFQDLGSKLERKRPS